MQTTQAKYTKGQPVEIEVYNNTLKASEWLAGCFVSYVTALDRDEPRINCTLADGREISGAAPECVRPFLVDDFEMLKKETMRAKNFVRVTERLHDYALEVLPPIYLKNGTFQMGECYSGRMYFTFGEKDGHFWGCLCDSLFSTQNF